jgi:hypothetical protein
MSSLRIAAVALAAALLVESTAHADNEGLAGIYDGVHPHWKDTVHLHADGTYKRGNGDPGRWKAEGDILVLDWTNWGLVIMTRVAPGKFKARSDGFTITLRGSPREEPRPDRRDRKPRAAGDAEFNGIMTALKSTSNELVRKEMAIQMLETSWVSAEQFGKMMALFNNELNRLDFVRQRAERIVDPKAALGYASTFNNGLNAKEYVELITKL